MIKNKFFLKNLLYFFGFGLCTLCFVVARCFQVLCLTNLQTGICHELRFFNFGFILALATFTILSYLFFRFVYTPTSYKNFDFIKFDHNHNNDSVGLAFRFSFTMSLIASIVVLISSFSMFFIADSLKKLVPAPFSFLFFLTSLIFSVSLAAFPFSFACGVNCRKFCSIFVFASAILWTGIRLVNLIFTSAYLQYANLEYEFNVFGLVCIFAFFYYFGRLSLNYNALNASRGLLTFGFTSAFTVLANVIPKLCLNVYCCFSNADFSGVFFERNISFLNFYNFNLVDLIVSLFIISFTTWFVKQIGFKNC